MLARNSPHSRDVSQAGANGDIGPSAALAEATARDKELIQKLLAGDELAFGQLVERLHRPMLRLARSIAGNPAGAEEVVQETWAVVLDSLSRFEGRSSLKTWVFRILSNRAKTWAARERRASPLPFSEGDEPDGEPAVDPGRFTFIGSWAAPPVALHERSPEELLLSKEVRSILACELDGVPPGQRAVVMLRDVEGCTADEVCDILGISDENQRVLLHRGRSKLRAALEHYVNMR